MTNDAGKLTIYNLRDGGEVRLHFPEEITTSDRTNWNGADVANALKPLLFANVEPQKISLKDLCIDNTRTNESVEPTIARLRSWMRAGGERESSPPPLQIITVGFQQRVILSELSARRQFFTTEGICIRVYLTMSFEELRGAAITPAQVSPKRRSGNSLSGRT